LEGGLGKVARGARGEICRTALHLTHELPDLTYRRDDLARSQNERLGALIDLLAPAGHPARGAGADFDPLPLEYLGELMAYAEANAEDLEEQIANGRKKRQGAGHAG
jgi:hypothetical protein